MEKILNRQYTGDEFLNAISPNGELYHLLYGRYVFRGHSSEKWVLVPSALRKDAFSDVFYDDEHRTRINSQASSDSEDSQIVNEIRVLRNFFEKCDKYGLQVPEVKRLRDEIYHSIPLKLLREYEEWISPDFYELASLAQHYGIPTRLLDWSNDILISLYFAISGLKDLKEDERTDNFVIWALDTRLADFVYHPNTPLRMIRPRYHGNPNIIAQKGLFTFWASIKGINPETHKSDMAKVNHESLDQLVEKSFEAEKTPLMYCLKIDCNSANALYSYLKHHHVEAATIFPGFGGIVRSIKENQEYIKNFNR